jgi:hypothetical protein
LYHQAGLQGSARRKKGRKVAIMVGGSRSINQEDEAFPGRKDGGVQAVASSFVRKSIRKEYAAALNRSV